MIRDRQLIVDGQLEFSRGEETHKSPSRVPRNQLCLLINGTTRQDYLTQRPGFKKRGFVLSNFLTDNDSELARTAVKNAFQLGLWQGAGVYNPDVGESYFVASVSGRLWKVELNGRVTEITGYDGSNSSIAPQAWFCQAENYLVWQDGIDGAIIYNGAKAWRSRLDGSLGELDGHSIKEVPTGTCMEYAMGRLWVALPGGRSFVAGDLVYSSSGTPALNYRDSVIRFAENTFLAEGGAFSVPANSGPIQAMKAVANLDTSLGQGPLQVFTTQACFSVNAPYDRTLWKDVTYPIQTVSLINDGALAQNSTVQVNGDLWYRGHNGIRSFIIARRDFTQWGNRAMSHEVGRHIDKDTKEWLRFGSACSFDDRLLMTCDPHLKQGQGVYHRGLVALDFHPLTSINEVEPPSWDGMWTADFDILQILKVESDGVPRCFVFTLEYPDGAGVRRIGLWELTTESYWDTDLDGNETRIATVLEGPRLNFEPSGSNRLEQKILEGCDLWVSNMRGHVDIYIYYRPDQYPCWIPWKHGAYCSKDRRCLEDAVDGCLTGLNLKPQYRTRLAALQPPLQCIDFTQAPSNVAYEFQVRMEIFGSVELQAYRIGARRQLETIFGACMPEDATCEELVCCQEDAQLPIPYQWPKRYTRRDANSPGESINITQQVITTEDNQAIQSEQGDNFTPG